MEARIAPEPPVFPDDPRKWDGWSNYQSANPYERLCLNPADNPDTEQIQQHCTALLQWWKKKLPLKNQPTNPLAQLLGRGLDDFSRYLLQAQMQLLDPEQRRKVDRALAEEAQQNAIEDFARYVAFCIKDGVLTAEAKANLAEYGQRNGLSDAEIARAIEEELRRNEARPAEAEEHAFASGDSEHELIRILRLSEVNFWSATDSVRQILITVGTNLGIERDRTEFLLDDFLEQEEFELKKPVISASTRSLPTTPVRVEVAPPGPAPANFVNSLGAAMLFIPAGEFIMGSDAIDAAPNESPLTPVKLSGFYMSRHPVTNAQYEQFDPTHRQKRMSAAGDQHPVVYVSSIDAGKFCQWLSQRDGRKYRLPTEAEWEYAARGNDGRKYPWGDEAGAGDLANFADASTTFAWRDTLIHDGHPESSPVGAYPRGTSPFGLEDMAGNVWEWCLDFFAPLSGVPKQNPRGAAPGAKRVYRGGSWKSRFANLRTTARGSNIPTYSCNDLGFRIVCEQ